MTDIVATLSECLKASFSPVTSRLISEVVREDPDFNEIASVIGMDPALAAMVLTLVNSPYYGFTQKCTDLQRAAVVLGTQEILKLALTVSFHKTLTPEKGPKGTAEHFIGWRLIVWAAIASELLAERLAPQETSRVYLCALFKDLSLLLVDCVLPELFPSRGGICLRENQLAEEEQILGMQHGALTKTLLAQWDIPLDLCEGIHHHHDMDRLDEHEAYCQCIILATRWAELEHCRRKDPGTLLRFELMLRSRLGVSEEELEELRRRARDRFTSMLQTLGISEAPPDERLYRHSLQEMQRFYFQSMELMDARGGLNSIATIIFRQLRLDFGVTDAELCLSSHDGNSRCLYAYREGIPQGQPSEVPGEAKIPWTLPGSTQRFTADNREYGVLRLPPNVLAESETERQFLLYARFLSQSLEHYHAGRAALESKALLLDHLPVAVARADRQGRLVECNQRFNSALGSTKDLSGRPVAELLSAQLGIAQERVWRDFPGSDRQTVSRIYCLPLPGMEGQLRCMHLAAHRITAQPSRDLVYVLQDVTELTEIEVQALRERDFLETLIASMRDLVLTVDATGGITFASPRFSDKLVGRNLFSISRPGASFTGLWEASALDEQLAPIEVLLVIGETAPLALELIFSPLGGQAERSWLVVGRDVSAVRRLEEKLKHQAMYDGLTGLLNHTQFLVTLEREVLRAQRTGRPLGLIFMDLDDFKKVNDSDGHQAGDEILKTVGLILRQHTRKGMDFPCRYGGDEFAVIFTEITPRHLAMLAGRLDKSIRDQSGDRVGISAGVALLQTGETAESLLRRADSASYKAKSAGGRRVMIAD